MTPLRCKICGQYFTTHPYFMGRRCLEPGHWQAAGLLTAADYYPMGQLVAEALKEQIRLTGAFAGSASPTRPDSAAFPAGPK